MFMEGIVRRVLRLSAIAALSFCFSVSFLAGHTTARTTENAVNVEQLLRVQSLSSSAVETLSCDRQANQDQIRHADADISRKDWVRASADSEIAASTIAYCYIKTGGAKGSFIPTNVAAAMVGRLLFQAGAAARISGVVTPASEDDLQRARILLLYAKQHGQNTSAVLKQLDALLEGKPQPKAAATADAHMTALQATQAFKGNSFGFRSRYLGKTISITGPVRAVTDMGGNEADVLLTGINESDGPWADEISCDVTDVKALARAASLAPGQRVTVSGVYTDPGGPFDKMMVTLKPCLIK